MKAPPYSALLAFETVARLGSVKAAAEALFVTPAAVSYQIKQLEAQLEVALFIRGNRSIVLSDAGQRALEDVREGFALIQRGIHKATRRDAANVINLSAGPAFTVKWLAPRLHEFVQANPEIDARVVANVRFSDFVSDGVDLAIRFSRRANPSLESINLIEDWAAPMVSPRLAREAGQQPENLLDRVDLIHDDSLAFDPEAPTWPGWLDRAGLPPDPAAHGVRFNQADHALQMAIDGHGVVLGRFALAIPDLLAGRLVIPFGPVMRVGASFQVVAPPENFRRPPVKALVDWLVALYRAEADRALAALSPEMAKLLAESEVAQVAP